MQRNPMTAAVQTARRQARLDQMTAADAIGGAPDTRSTREAGETDGSGNWLQYGQLDLTTFGEGFRLSNRVIPGVAGE